MCDDNLSAYLENDSLFDSKASAVCVTCKGDSYYDH